MKNLFLLLLTISCLNLNAQHEQHQNPNTDNKKDHSMQENLHNHSLNLEAPISVMGSHMHEKGSWMVSYRYMNMNMNGLRRGTKDISIIKGYDAGYMITPLNMDMNMHMVGLMYAPSEKLTLITMFNIVENDMDLQMRNMISGMLMPFSTSSTGFGDIKIAGLYNFLNKSNRTLHGQFGLSLPTGSIDETAVTPMSNQVEVVMPYPMQIGSGTVDSELGLTYVSVFKTISWGNQLKGTFRFGENSNAYRLGNTYKLNTWLAVKAFDWLSISGRLEGLLVDEISGANPKLNSMMVTTADIMNSGGKFLNSGVGFNIYVLKGALKDLEVGAEFELPLYQNVNGIQLKQKNSLTLGLLYSF